MIALEGVCLEHKTQHQSVVALDSVDLQVDEGELVALVGPSGSGKTSLLNLVGGLDRPSKGRVTVGGCDLAQMSDAELSVYRSSRVGFVFQAFHLHPARTAVQNASVPLYFSSKPMRDGLKRAYELLERLGLQGLEHRPVSALSGGQRQRVAVVRALVNRPAVLLADEPIGSLDAESARLVLDLFVELRSEEGLTALVATHDDLLTEHASRVASLTRGRLAVAR